eukprot:sb/3467681/
MELWCSIVMALCIAATPPGWTFSNQAPPDGALPRQIPPDGAFSAGFSSSGAYTTSTSTQSRSTTPKMFWTTTPPTTHRPSPTSTTMKERWTTKQTTDPRGALDCQIIVYHGYIKERCTAKSDEAVYYENVFRCASSPNVVYSFPDDPFADSFMGPLIRFAMSDRDRCQGDNGFYQMCGLVQDPETSVYTIGSDGSIALCGYQLCHESYEGWGGITGQWRHCLPPKNDDTSEKEKGICDNFCRGDCQDESYCNGIQYGVYCTPIGKNEVRYVDPSKVQCCLMVHSLGFN